MTDNDMPINFDVNNLKSIFKLPIYYQNNKYLLEKNIHSDLELTELTDNSNNCLYDSIFEPKIH